MRTIIASAAAAVVALIIGISVGVGATSEPAMPTCAEDEYLGAIDYPYTDTSNLRCVHVDVISGQAERS